MRVDLQTGCSAKQHWTLRLDRDTASPQHWHTSISAVYLLLSEDLLIIVFVPQSRF